MLTIAAGVALGLMFVGWLAGDAEPEVVVVYLNAGDDE